MTDPRADLVRAQIRPTRFNYRPGTPAAERQKRQERCDAEAADFDQWETE